MKNSKKITKYIIKQTKDNYYKYFEETESNVQERKEQIDDTNFESLETYIYPALSTEYTEERNQILMMIIRFYRFVISQMK